MICKKELSFAVLALIAHSASVYASDNQLHEMCMKSKDYIGCMKSYSNNQKPIKNKCVEKFGKRECVLNAYIDSTCKSKGDMDQFVTTLSDRLKSMGLQWRAYSKYSLGSDAEEFNASHILVETEEAAVDMLEILENGMDFAELAREKSSGPSGPNGGQLGWFGLGQMVPEFEAAVMVLEIGNISRNPKESVAKPGIIKRIAAKAIAAPEIIS